MKKLLLTILGVLALCGGTFYATYAFFHTSIEQNESGTTASSGNFDITYTKGNDIIGGVLTPTTSKTNGLNTSMTIKKNASSIDSKYSILLNFTTLEEGLNSQAFKWEVYRNDEANPINAGNFSSAVINTPITLVTDQLLTTTQTSYTIYLWLDGSLAGNETQNKNFSASLKIETYQINKQ